MWDTARCSGSTAELRKVLPLNLIDAGPPALNRNKSASLPRQLCSTGGLFTLKDISDDEDDEHDDPEDRLDGGNLQNARFVSNGSDSVSLKINRERVGCRPDRFHF